MLGNNELSNPICVSPSLLPARTEANVLTRGSDWLYLTTLLLLMLLVSGCASLPTDYPRTTSTAFQDHESTVIGKHMSEDAANHPGESGFALLRYGHTAFSARITATEMAEKTLDVQYYIWEADQTGRILAERLVRAADRGVRVRLLVDDINIAGRDATVASIDAHPNIEIRIFNPFANRSKPLFDFITDLGRVNHRMHNKILVMDNTLAIVGGRNIGDSYFAVNPETNFRDLDIAAAGPIVREISTVFDRFWSGDWAVPIEVIVGRPYTSEDLRHTVTKLRSKLDKGGYPYSVDEDVASITNNLSTIRANLIWAPGRIVWDDPSSIEAEGEAGVMVEALFRKLQSLQQELIVESAYIVVGDRGIEGVQQLHDRGVRVRVLTNSLASNDVVAAHAGHAEYRKQLLAAGAEVYEIRPDSGVIRKNWSGESNAGLHTKAMVFDRESVFIGSFNLDPRSAKINTEAGLYVESPELAAQVLSYMNEGVQPENSYRVLLDEDGDLYWVTEDEGVEVRYDKEPETTFGQRFMSGFIAILPVESQL